MHIPCKPWYNLKVISEMLSSKLVELNLHLLALRGEAQEDAQPRLEHALGLVASCLTMARLQPRMGELASQGLAPAHLQLVPLLAEGKDASAIADELGITAATVTRRLGTLRRILGLPRSSSLAEWANEQL